MDLRHVTIQVTGLPALHALVNRLLQSGYRAEPWHVALSAHDVAVRDASSSHAITSVHGAIRTEAAGSEVKLDLVGADAETAPAGADGSPTLRFVRIRESGTPAGGFELHSGAWAVPCAWLFALSGELPGLASSRFQGSLAANEDEAGWHLDVRGRLTGIDLGELIGRQFSHEWQGTADVTIRSVHIDAGRLSTAEFEIAGGPGHIGGSLAVAAIASLGCTSSYRTLPEQMLAYRQLAASVRIDPQGQLVMTGQCAGTPGTILASSDGKPLLTQPAKQPQPVLNVVHALVGMNDPLVPATPQTAQLLRVLPLPQSGTPLRNPAQSDVESSGAIDRSAKRPAEPRNR